MSFFFPFFIRLESRGDVDFLLWLMGGWVGEFERALCCSTQVGEWVEEEKEKGF